MAKNIRGITIEIGGDTTKLDKALKDVNKASRDVNKELRQIQNSLKFNPGNTELLEQQQRKLAEQIDNTSEKLDVLKIAHRQAETQLANGDLGQDEFDALTREIIKTENQLERYTKQLQASEREAEAFATANRDLQTLFDATGKSVDDFADVLGNKLTHAIKDGRADSQQLEQAIEKIGKSSLGADADIDKLRATLAKADSGSSIDDVSADLNRMEQEARDAEDGVESLGERLSNLASAAGIDEALDGLADGISNAADEISDVVTDSLETGSRNAVIDVTMDLDEASTQAVKDSLVTIQAYGLDAEDALNGIRRQFQLNADASDETNQRIIEDAGAIAAAYNEIDFSELIQETNEIAGQLNISDENALALVNSLLKVGFPAGELDIIAEYGGQLQRAGYDAEEIQAIFAAGIETDTWNIDNLMDGLKEGRVLLTEFGVEVDDATADLLEGTDISAKKLQEWGQAVAGGGEQGKQAMQEVAEALVGVEDKTKQNELGVKFFGTMWEDQGTNITDTLLNIDDHLKTTDENQKDLANTTEGMQDANYKWNEAILTLQASLAPLMETVSEVVSKIADWVRENPKLTAAIGSVIGVVTVLLPIITSIVTLFTSLSVAAGLAGTTIGALIAPVLAVIGVVAALVAAGVALWQNWDTIKEKAKEIAEAIPEKIEEMKFALEVKWLQIKTDAAIAWEELKESISQTIENAKQIVGEKIDKLKFNIQVKWLQIKTDAAIGWENIKNSISEKIETAKQAAISKVEEIKMNLSNKWTEIKTNTINSWENIKTAISDKITGAKNRVSEILTQIKTNVRDRFNEVRATVSDIWGQIKSAITTPINEARDAVKRAIDRIKGIMDFEWSLPKLKLPRLSVSGKFSLMPPQVPKFDINWYKDGGIFDSPSVIGVGEAGKEAVLPLNDETLGNIGRHIAKTMKPGNPEGSGDTYNINVSANGTMTQQEKLELAKIIEKEIKKANDRKQASKGNRVVFG